MKNYFLSIFYGVAWLVIGTKCLISSNVYWNWLGFILYIVGFVLIALASWWTMWDKFIEKTQAMQYLFDSARHLDNERLGALLYALGLKPLPVKQTQPSKMDVTVMKRDQQGAITEQRKYSDIPALPNQLNKLADGLLNGAPFSRRRWTMDDSSKSYQKVFSQGGFAKLQAYCLDPKNGLAIWDDDEAEPTDDFIDFLSGYASSPSPTPPSQPMEVAQNQAI